MLILLASLLQFAFDHSDPGGEWGIWHQTHSPTPRQSAYYGRALAVLGDINHDGSEEYVVGATQEEYLGMYAAGAVYLVDGATGSVLAGSHGVLPAASHGWSVCRVGDVNGDQLPDYAATSRGVPLGSPAVHVYDGASGSLLYEISKPLDARSFPSDLTGVGDWNLDQIPDFAVSDYWHTVNGGSQTGTVYIYSGLDGTLLQQLDGWGPGHAFGTGISGGGDADGDGREDLLVWSRWGVGDSVHVIAGGSGQEIYRLGSRTGNGYFGSSRAFIADVDGDGCDEILVGAGYAGPFDHGEAYMYSGRTGVLLRSWASETEYDSEYAKAICSVGDLDRDGLEDIAISAPASHNPSRSSRIYIYSGVDGHLLSTITRRSATWFGTALAGGGDVDGDGRADLIIGDDAEDVQGVPDSGAVYVFTFDPFLTASEISLSSSHGGTMTFTLNFPASEAGLNYALLASNAALGDPLGIDRSWINIHGVQIPLVETPWTYLTWNRPPSVLAGAQGALDPQGDAIVTLTLAPGLAAAAVGHSFRFAAVSIAGGSASMSSAAAHLSIVP